MIFTIPIYAFYFKGSWIRSKSKFARALDEEGQKIDANMTHETHFEKETGNAHTKEDTKMS